MIAELARVTRPGGNDPRRRPLAPIDPLAGFELTRFERARDPRRRASSPTPTCAALRFEQPHAAPAGNHEPRDVDAYLDSRAARATSAKRARSLAPSGYEASSAGSVLTPYVFTERSGRTPGRERLAHATGRYQRGTTISRLSLSTASSRRWRDERRVHDELREHRPKRSRCETFGLDEARIQRYAPKSRAARARLRSSARTRAGHASTRSRGRSRPLPATETTLATWGTLGRARAGTRGSTTRSRGSSRGLRARSLPGRRRGSSRARRHPACSGAGRCADAARARAPRALDGGPVGDVALLVLVRLGRAARKPDDVRTARAQRTHQFGADPGRKRR